MEVKPLKIGDLVAKIPIIQGGMGVGVSLSSLAGAVAREGGIGVLSAAQIGYNEPDFEQDPEGANMRAMKKHIRKAREIAPDGVIGINIMVATRPVSYTHLDVYKRQGHRHRLNPGTDSYCGGKTSDLSAEGYPYLRTRH